MKSENVLMFVVLAGVLLVGISGLVFSNPGISGMVSVNQEYAYSINDFIDLAVDKGAGTNTSFSAKIIPVSPFQDPTTFDTFGNCTGCTINITSSPVDPDYAGLADNNQSLCYILENNANVPINLSTSLLNMLPSGWYDMRVATRSYRNMTDTGTRRFHLNNLTDSFDYSNSLSLGPAIKPLLGNWSDGSGFGQGVKEAGSCYWSFDVYGVRPGTYTFNIYLLGFY